MAQITDFTTDVAKVRLLIADADDTDQLFGDNAIQTFINMARNGNLKRAAATAFLSIAANEVLVQKRIKILDLQTDGPAEAAQLRLMAQQYQKEADQDELADAGGAFDFAEMVVTGRQYRERQHNESLRS